MEDGGLPSKKLYDDVMKKLGAKVRARAYNSLGVKRSNSTPEEFERFMAELTLTTTAPSIPRAPSSASSICSRGLRWMEGLQGRRYGCLPVLRQRANRGKRGSWLSSHTLCTCTSWALLTGGWMDGFHRARHGMTDDGSPGVRAVLQKTTGVYALRPV